MTEHNDFQRSVIEEFRANGGKVGGQLAQASLLLLTTIGAKSGLARVTPLGYLTDGDRMVIFASNRGSQQHPAWYHNLVAHPEVTIEVGNERFQATATTAEGEEREQIWARALISHPFLADHQANTTRPIPLVILSRHTS